MIATSLDVRYAASVIFDIYHRSCWSSPSSSRPRDHIKVFARLGIRSNRIHQPTETSKRRENANTTVIYMHVSDMQPLERKNIQPIDNNLRGISLPHNFVIVSSTCAMLGRIAGSAFQQSSHKFQISSEISLFKAGRAGSSWREITATNACSWRRYWENGSWPVKIS
jgi:hypothetical protein